MMDKLDKLILTSITSYIVVAILYGTFCYNHDVDYYPNPYDTKQMTYNYNRGINAVASGAFWPFTISWKLALFVTRWP